MCCCCRDSACALRASPVQDDTVRRARPSVPAGSHRAPQPEPLRRVCARGWAGNRVQVNRTDTRTCDVVQFDSISRTVPADHDGRRLLAGCPSRCSEAAQRARRVVAGFRHLPSLAVERQATAFRAGSVLGVWAYRPELGSLMLDSHVRKAPVRRSFRGRVVRRRDRDASRRGAEVARRVSVRSARGSGRDNRDRAARVRPSPALQGRFTCRA